MASSGRAEEGWSPWIIHDGSGCPLPTGTIVEIVSEDGFGFAKRELGAVSGESFSSWNWSYFPELKRIIRYRSKSPRGLRMLEDQMRDLDAPSRTRDTRKPVSAK